MNQFDLVAAPIREIFIDNPPQANFRPWTHVANEIALDTGVNASTQTHVAQNMSPKAKVLQAGWLKKKTEVFAGKYHIPDSEDPDTVAHYNWYEATGFKVPFPGEKTVRPASDFRRKAPAKTADLDD